jgi:hypothetical protein
VKEQLKNSDVVLLIKMIKEIKKLLLSRDNYTYLEALLNHESPLH